MTFSPLRVFLREITRISKMKIDFDEETLSRRRRRIDRYSAYGSTTMRGRGKKEEKEEEEEGGRRRRTTKREIKNNRRSERG